MELLGKSLIELKNLIKEKKLSSKEVYEYFLKRSKKYNTDLNVYMTLVDDYKSNENEDLQGLPLVVKDNFCTKGVRTTASAKVLDTFVPPYESTVTERLLEHGASLLGKTNMDAWAHGSSTETSDYGPTRNPWDTTRMPGGSSGGSAAAVSAYLAPAAIGSETAGSIRQPAAWCGVVGLKPTYGRVPRYGVIAMGSSFDCPGPMTLNVEDTAYLMNVIAGKDQYDATSVPDVVPDYMSEMKLGRKLTIGVPEEYYEGLDGDIVKKLDESIKVFEKMGHKVKKISLLSPKYSLSVYTILQRAEVASNLARYTGVRYGTDRTVFGHEAKRRMMLGTYTLSHGYYDAFYTKAQKVKTLVIQDFQRIFKEVDLIMASPTPITALPIGESEKYSFFGETMDLLNEAACVAGIPAISIPCGLDSRGLPIGLQFMGNYLQEGLILDASYQYEKETNFYDVVTRGVKNYKD